MKKTKLKILLDTLSFVYSSNPASVLIREFLLLVTVFLNIYSITVWGRFLDATEQYLTKTTTFNIASFFTSESFYFLALGTGLYLLSFSLERFRTFLTHKIDQHLAFACKTVFFNKIEMSNLEDIEQKKYRDLMIFADSYGTQNLFLTYKTFTNILKNLVTGVSALIIILNGFGLVSLVLVLFALPETIFGYISRRRVKRYHEKEVERIKWVDYVENLMTRINFFPEMKVDGTFKNVKKQYSTKSFDFIENIIEMNKHMYIDTTFLSVLGKLFTAIFVIFAIAQSVVYRFTIGHFKALYDYSVSVYESFFHIFDMSFTISNYLEYAQKFLEFKDFKGFGDVYAGNKLLPNGPLDLKFKDLDFVYPDGKEKVLENLNLTVKGGERIMIIGDDGSGKTTLIKIFCGLYRIVAGDFEIGGYSIRELARGELKKRISVVFQEYVNYNMTLKDNVTLSSDERRIDQELYEKALKISGVDKLMKHFEIFHNQMLGKYVSGGKDISPGFWQRLAIARMIYRDRDIFILDEPFNNIDDKEEERILKSLFNHLEKNKTVIYITRDNRHTEMFDRVYTLTNGKLTLKS